MFNLKRIIFSGQSAVHSACSLCACCCKRVCVCSLSLLETIVQADFMVGF